MKKSFILAASVMVLSLILSFGIFAGADGSIDEGTPEFRLPGKISADIDEELSVKTENASIKSFTFKSDDIGSDLQYFHNDFYLDKAELEAERPYMSQNQVWGEWEEFAPYGKSTGKYLFTAAFNPPELQKDIPVMVRTDDRGNSQFKFIGWGAEIFTARGIDLIVNMDSEGRCTVPRQNTGFYHPQYGEYILVQDYSSLTGEESPCFYDSDVGVFHLPMIYYISLGSFGSHGETLTMRKDIKDRETVDIESTEMEVDDTYLQSDNAVIFYVTDVPGYSLFAVTSNNTEYVEGTYKWSEKGINNLNSFFVREGSSIKESFQDGEFTVKKEGDKTILTGWMIGEDEILYNLNISYSDTKVWSDWEDFAPFGKNTGKYRFTAAFDPPEVQKDILVKVRRDNLGNSQFKFIGWGAGIFSAEGIDLIVNMDSEGNCTVPGQNTGYYHSQYGEYIMVQDYASLTGEESPCYYDSSIGMFQMSMCYYISLGSFGTHLETLEMRKDIPDRATVDIESTEMVISDAYLSSDNAVIFYVKDVPGYRLFRVTTNNANSIEGTFKWSDKGINDINSYFVSDSSPIEDYFQDGEFTVRTEGNKVILTGWMIGEDERIYNLNLSYTETIEWSEWEDFEPFGKNTGKYWFNTVFDPPVQQKDIEVTVRSNNLGDTQFKFAGWGAGIFTQNGIDLIVNMDSEGHCNVPRQNTGNYLPQYGEYLMIQDYASLTGEEEPCYYDDAIGVFQLPMVYYISLGYFGTGLETLEMRKDIPDRETVNIESSNLCINDVYLQSDGSVLFYVTDVPGFSLFRITSDGADSVDGTYKWSEKGINDLNSYFVREDSSVKEYFQDGEFTVKTEENKIVLTGWMIGEDERIYNVNLSYEVPVTGDTNNIFSMIIFVTVIAGLFAVSLAKKRVY